jgi:hypothetical protein
MDDFEKELPTRPDGLVPSRKCKHCGRAYGDHAQTAQPQNLMPCNGTRKGYERDDGDDHVR